MDIQKITDKIANMQRAIKTATTVVLKNKLKSKIAELKEDLKNANVPTSKLAKSLLGSQRKVANYSKAEFKSAIKTLAKRDEYSFLKRYTIAEIEDDRERYAKPVGWRFKGRKNIKKPTAKELAIGKARGTVYYESRPNRSDVVRPVKLAEGGKIKSIVENYKKTITKKYNNYIADTESADLKKLYKRDLQDHLYVIEALDRGLYATAYNTWHDMDTASREETTKDAYDLMTSKIKDEYEYDNEGIFVRKKAYNIDDYKYAKGGSTHGMGFVKVKFSNPKYNFVTSVNGDVSEAEARKYFVGQMFDVGVYPNENMQKVIDIEFHAKGSSNDSYAKGGSVANSYQVIIDNDWDEPKQFKTFSLAKKYIVENVKNHDLELVDMYGDSIYCEKGSTKKDLDWLFDSTSYAKGGITEHGLKVGDTIISKGRKGNEIVGVNRDEHEIFTTDLNKGKRDVQGMYFKKGGDVMPFEKYEAIHEEIHENKYNKGGSVSNAVDKHIATRNACLKHGATLDAYKMAHKQYAKGGKIGDSGIIQDPNSLYNGKMGTIVGDDGGFFLVKTIKGTGLVKKTRIKIVADDFAKGGSLKKKDDVLAIKEKLNKSFALPYEMAIYVPSTYGADKNISSAEFKSRIKAVELFLSNLFGGYSKVDADGGYVSQEKGLITENVARVTSFATKENFENNLKKLVDQISKWCDEWGQESMGYEFEGDLFYIEKGFKFQKGGNITKELDVLWRWSGLTVYQIIEILNALIDAGITDENLKTKLSKSSSVNNDRKAKKTVEVWKKAKPYYIGSLEGNMYYSLVYNLIGKANSGETILEDWKNNPSYNGSNQIVRYQKPYNDDWRFADGGKINSAYGDMVFTKLANVESAYRSMTKPENYAILIKKDKSNYLVTTNKRAKMFTDEYEMYGYGDKSGILKKYTNGGMTEREEDSEYVLYDLFKNKARANYSKFCELALKKGYSPIEIDEWYEAHNEDEYAKGGVTKKEFVGKKVGQVMHEFKQKNLHIGTSGKIVKKRKQAVAIALNVANEGWKHRKKK